MPTTKRDVFLVYEHVNNDSALPMLLQEWVGYSHVKLVVLTDGHIRDHRSTGEVYDVWKDDEANIGFGETNEKGEVLGLPWEGPKECKRYEYLGTTSASNAEILKAANSAISDMRTYNVVTRNCKIFALKLGAAIIEQKLVSKTWYEIHLEDITREEKEFSGTYRGEFFSIR